MNDSDSFAYLAPFYDRIMSHVDYARWQRITTTLAALLSSDFVHVDLACGTGALLKRLRAMGWHSMGVDLSEAMLRAGMKGRKTGSFPGAAADLRALPFRGVVDYATCLFDSMNFLLTQEDVDRALAQVYQALTPGGLLYFDVVTERMVLDHFDGQDWDENNGRFRTTWSSRYDRNTRVATTEVRVNTDASGVIRERIYMIPEIEKALAEAGFTLLGAYDARTWKAPGKRSIRVDFVAAKNPTTNFIKRFEALAASI